MGKYANVPERIDLGEFDAEYDGGWVDVKKRRTFGDRQEIRAAGMEVTDGGVKLNVGASAVKELQVAIVGWSFEQPCTADEITELPEDLGEWLLDRIRDLYAGQVRTPATKSRAVGRPAVGASRKRSAGTA